jgi:hypothetical protein
MALERIGGSPGNGVAFLVSAGIVYEVIAANCSSPQTAELNASKRADTLMKWVNLGVGQAALFVIAAALFDRGHAKPILAGGAVAAGFMYGLYAHSIRSGLSNPGPPTEQYPQAGG